MKQYRIFIAIALLLTAMMISACNSPNAVTVGKPAGDISLKTVDGHTWHLLDQKGSVVVVDFWATWCPPCRMSLPNLNRLSADQSLAARGLKVVAVNSQESSDIVKTFLAANHYTLPVVLDTDGAAENAYQVTGLPTTLVIGRDGLVKYATDGFEPQTSESELSAAIDKALAEK